MSTLTELPGLLRALQLKWEAFGMNVDAYYAPPLTPNETRALLNDAGLSAQDEIIDWYSWRNGLLREDAYVVAAPCRYVLFSCQQAVENFHMRQQLAIELNEYGEAPGRWRDTWLPIAEGRSGTVLVADLAPGSDTCQIHGFHWDSPIDIDKIRAPTITRMVKTWLKWFDLGLWSWDAAQERWHYNYAAIPTEIRISGIH